VRADDVTRGVEDTCPRSSDDASNEEGGRTGEFAILFTFPINKMAAVRCAFTFKVPNAEPRMADYSHQLVTKLKQCVELFREMIDLYLEVQIVSSS
jgi:hypothetical protein